MADIDVVKGATSVTLTLDEEEALYVLGILGHGTGRTPDVYGELFNALKFAGYPSSALYEQTLKWKVKA